MEKNKIRKKLYDSIWSIVNKQFKQRITIRKDPEDDKYEDIDEHIDIGKYYGTISWRLWRNGQTFIINLDDCGLVSVVLEEMVHRDVTIIFDYNGNLKDYLDDVNKIITDLTYSFLEGNWHVLMDYLSPNASNNDDWRLSLELYKQYEREHPYEGRNITYM